MRFKIGYGRSNAIIKLNIVQNEITNFVFRMVLYVVTLIHPKREALACNIDYYEFQPYDDGEKKLKRIPSRGIFSFFQYLAIYDQQSTIVSEVSRECVEVKYDSRAISNSQEIMADNF